MGKLNIEENNISKLSVAEWMSYTLFDLAEKDERIVCLSADIATSNKMIDLSDLKPPRFINAGLAEQNMVGMAAGMALGGLIPFVSTFAVFLSMRAVEQLRTDILYPVLNVKFIGSHAGFSFSVAGATHNCIEDISILRSMPNIIILCPADGPELHRSIIAAYQTDGPVYIRINRGVDPIVTGGLHAQFKIGQANLLSEGDDLSVLCYGRTVAPALIAARNVQRKKGVKVRVLNFHTIKPIDRACIIKAAGETGRLLTVEDHNIIGGLGSAVSEVIAEENLDCVFVRMGSPDAYAPVAGSHEEIMKIMGYGPDDIERKILDLVT